jgi:hypothetical protein
VIHEVPFKARRIGTVDLPQLKVQYFDPDTGRIESVYHQTPPPMAGNVLVVILFAALTIVLSARGGRWFIQRYTRHRQREFAIHTVRDAVTAKEILLGLRGYAAAEGWPANLTVTDFLRFWQQRYHVSTELQTSLHCLSQLLYGGNKDQSLEKLKASLPQQLRQTWRRRRPPHQAQKYIWDSKNFFIPQ